MQLDITEASNHARENMQKPEIANVFDSKSAQTNQREESYRWRRLFHSKIQQTQTLSV